MFYLVYLISLQCAAIYADAEKTAFFLSIIQVRLPE